ncbi:hypothetical protein QN277_025973 [Acacia crassicarpa]|uniref:Uncharacterized protein n=1 Tax=Acacia crassicarpa TaxID=499986 RepID=A0AAE1MH70_9FABA|nr:hypothetical protein QN277_025973 [Acacia crassicarpa]
MRKRDEKRETQKKRTTKETHTQVLKIGVCVGVQKWVRWVGDSVKHEAIERAVRKVMVGEEGTGMRIRARSFVEKAREAVAEGGSSHGDLSCLIEELLSL